MLAPAPLIALGVALVSCPSPMGHRIPRWRIRDGSGWRAKNAVSPSARPHGFMKGMPCVASGTTKGFRLRQPLPQHGDPLPNTGVTASLSALALRATAARSAAPPPTRSARLQSRQLGLEEGVSIHLGQLEGARQRAAPRRSPPRRPPRAGLQGRLPPDPPPAALDCRPKHRGDELLATGHREQWSAPGVQASGPRRSIERQLQGDRAA